LPDLVVADTDANADFLARLAAVPRSRVRTCLVGAEERLFKPGWQPGDPFHALFVGKLIPLHGVDVILEAARLAPELQVHVIGTGQLDGLMKELPPNVLWREWVDYEQLPAEYWGAGCALGIFARSEKAARVIPNKAFQALACGTPLITADTRGARELLVDGENALLVPPGDPAALVQAVRSLAADPGLARRLGTRGREAYEEHASEDVLGARWRSLIAELL
jgi:glycosyltransferase involved in cell wall biosynthesis